MSWWKHVLICPENVGEIIVSNSGNVTFQKEDYWDYEHGFIDCKIEIPKEVAEKLFRPEVFDGMVEGFKVRLPPPPKPGKPPGGAPKKLSRGVRDE